MARLAIADLDLPGLIEAWIAYDIGSPAPSGADVHKQTAAREDVVSALDACLPDQRPELLPRAVEPVVCDDRGPRLVAAGEEVAGQRDALVRDLEDLGRRFEERGRRPERADSAGRRAADTGVGRVAVQEEHSDVRK